MLDLHVGDLRQRAAGARALLLPKISLEPLYSDRDTFTKRQHYTLDYKAKRNYYTLHKETTTLYAIVGSTDISICIALTVY